MKEKMMKNMYGTGTINKIRLVKKNMVADK